MLSWWRRCFATAAKGAQPPASNVVKGYPPVRQHLLKVHFGGDLSQVEKCYK